MISQPTARASLAPVGSAVSISASAYRPRVSSPRGNLPPVPVRFDHEEWLDEVERLDRRSLARIQAERARREIEAEAATLDWQKCEAEGDDRTRLLGCVKLYVPLRRQGASEAPFGFVFQLAQNRDTVVTRNHSPKIGRAYGEIRESLAFPRPAKSSALALRVPRKRSHSFAEAV